MEYFIPFSRVYLLIHILCLLIILVNFALQKQQLDFIEWVIIITNAPTIVLVSVVSFIFKGE